MLKEAQVAFWLGGPSPTRESTLGLENELEEREMRRIGSWMMR